MISTSALALPALLTLAASAAADTITVGPGGDFAEVADAVAAAAPWDVVLIAAGEHVDTKTIVVDKPLTILGAGSATTTYDAVPDFPTVKLPLLVTGLGPGEEVRVAGLKLTSAFFGGKVAVGAVIVDCQGPVILSDVVVGGFSNGLTGPSPLQVRNSAQVTLDGCRSASTSTSEGSPAAGLWIESSQVWVNGCTLSGSSAPATTAVFDGSPGIVAIDSVVRVSRSGVFGGNGAVPSLFFTPTVATAGGAAIAARGTTQVYVRGGTDNELRGGAGGEGVNGVPVYGPGGAAVTLEAGSLLTTTPDVVANAGADGDGPVTTPVVDGPGAWAPLAFALATLESADKLVAPGGTVDLELGGEPNTLFATYFALAQGPALVAPGFAGPIVLPPGAFVPLAPVLLDGSGAGALAVALPPSPALVGLGIVVQGLELSSLATFSVSAPTFVGVR